MRGGALLFHILVKHYCMQVYHRHGWPKGTGSHHNNDEVDFLIILGCAVLYVMDSSLDLKV